MSCGVLKNRLSICVSNKTKFFTLYDSKSIILLHGHFNPCLSFGHKVGGPVAKIHV